MTIPIDQNTPVDIIEKQHHHSDLFTILQLTAEATTDEIKSKYAELLLVYHPDKGGDPKKFRDLQVAYKILSDPNKRAIYAKSLSSSFDDITKEYKDIKTGKSIDLGYLANEDDFDPNKGTTEVQLIKKDKFMTGFENSRTENEKLMLNEMKKDNEKKNLSFDELKNLRDTQDKQVQIELDEELGATWKRDVNQFNSIFNQMFETNKKQQITDLAPFDEPNAIGQSGLAPLDSTYGGSSMFNSDPWSDYQDQGNFLTYKQPNGLKASQFDAKIDTTRTLDQNPEDLTAIFNKRMQEQMASRDQLLNMDPSEFQIKPEHNPRNNPLSHLNMLGNDFACQTIDPPKPLIISKHRQNLINLIS